MKRSREDEKSMGPMFPRLHVNDTEKGGPRAPPRNKMALYEQLSIPSQRFTHGVLPLNRTNSGNLVPHGSSSQRFPSISPGGGGKVDTALQQMHQHKKIGDEDDFRVPIFVQSETDKSLRKTHSAINLEKRSPSCETYPAHSMKIWKIGGNNEMETTSTGNQMKEIPDSCVSSRDHTIRSQKTFVVGENGAGLDDSLDQYQLLEESKQGSSPTEPKDNGPTVVVPDLMRNAEKGDVDQSGTDLLSREDRTCPCEPEIFSENREDNTGGFSHLVQQRSEDVSETSTLGSVSVLDVFPDDVAEIIGEKHFWSARKTILNQQRVFAVQVFELHRLIKVQRLIAGSPDLLFEESNLVAKPSSEVSFAKKLLSDYRVKPSMHKSRRKDDSEKQNYKMEYSAENAVGKASVSSGSQPLAYGPYVGNPMTVTRGTDNKAVPWCYSPSIGHQWLIPVMSPSEGLIYKPVVDPAYMGSACSRCGLGPYFSGIYVNPPNSVPTPHQHHDQGVDAPPGASPVVHGYSPPYGMPMMKQQISVLRQANYFAGTDAQGQAGELSGGGLDGNIRHHNSCNMLIQNSGTGAGQEVKQPQLSRDAELRGSMASSSCERVNGAGTAQATESRDALQLFPGSPDPLVGGVSHAEADLPTRVIRVIPHNARSATESAARIFQSIQEGRKQQDSV